MNCFRALECNSASTARKYCTLNYDAAATTASKVIEQRRLRRPKYYIVFIHNFIFNFYIRLLAARRLCIYGNYIIYMQLYMRVQCALARFYRDAHLFDAEYLFAFVFRTFAFIIYVTYKYKYKYAQHSARIFASSFK